MPALENNNARPFRADHVGSLLRPRSLIEAFKSHRGGEISAAALRAAQDAAILDAVGLQEAAGLKSITDGEFRRASYWARFVERVEGLEVREALFKFRDGLGSEQAFTAPHVAGRVQRRRDIAGDELEFLLGATRETAKLTLPSPPTMHFWRLNGGIEAAAYATMEAYFTDLATVYREEVAALAGAGATYLQFDEVPLAMLCDGAVRARVGEAGLDATALIGAYIDLFNHSLEARPAGMRIAVHLCRGNYKGRFLSEGGYDAIAERLFNELDVDLFFLEYDSPRAGDFRPLRFVPANKTVILGLVSTKEAQLETSEHLSRRIGEAASVLPLEQLGLSPQCGFASTVAGNPISLDEQKAKLALVVEVARQVWG